MKIAHKEETAQLLSCSAADFHLQYRKVLFKKSLKWVQFILLSQDPATQSAALAGTNQSSLRHEEQEAYLDIPPNSGLLSLLTFLSLFTISETDADLS